MEKKLLCNRKNTIKKGGHSLQQHAYATQKLHFLLPRTQYVSVHVCTRICSHSYPII